MTGRSAFTVQLIRFVGAGTVWDVCMCNTDFAVRRTAMHPQDFVIGKEFLIFRLHFRLKTFGIGTK